MYELEHQTKQMRCPDRDGWSAPGDREDAFCPETITDQTLEQAGTGDPDAERALYAATCCQVYDCIRSAVPDEETAQQIMVSVYVQAFRALRRSRMDGMASDRELAQRIDERLASLPEEQMLAVTMHLYDALSFREIAGALGKEIRETEKLYNAGMDALETLLMPGTELLRRASDDPEQG